MLTASLVEDNQKYFNLAINEFKILLADSVNNKKKLYSVFNYSGSILQSFELYSLHKESNELINFIDKTFNIESMKGVQKDISVLYLIYKAKLLKRNNKIKDAKLLFEQLFKESNVVEALENSKVDIIHTSILRLVVPELYEIYALENNYAKINSITQAFFKKNASQLKKRDLDDLHIYLSLNSIKIYKSLLIYFENSNNKKQFKIVAKHVDKHLPEILNHVKNNSYELVTVTVSSKIGIVNELAQIAMLYLQNGFIDNGKNILNKLYPLIIDDYNQRASRDHGNQTYKMKLFQTFI